MRQAEHEGLTKMDTPCFLALGKLSFVEREPRRNECRNKKGQGYNGDIMRHLGTKGSRTQRKMPLKL